MVSNPEVQVKAQAEIDRVLDNGRLPSFSDFGSLPYIDAIVKESLRWNPVVPLGACGYCVDNHTSTDSLNVR